MLEAAVRSWPPVEPRVYRWTFPIFTPDDSLDPAALKSPPARRRARAKQAREQSEPEWDVEKFVAEFITDELQEKFNIITAAIDAGLSERKAERLLKEAERKEMIHRDQPIKNKPASFSLSEPALVESG